MKVCFIVEEISQYFKFRSKFSRSYEEKFSIMIYLKLHLKIPLQAAANFSSRHKQCIVRRACIHLFSHWNATYFQSVYFYFHSVKYLVFSPVSILCFFANKVQQRLDLYYNLKPQFAPKFCVTHSSCKFSEILQSNMRNSQRTWN